MQNIGFIGLGAMGSEMAPLLSKAGYNVFGWPSYVSFDQFRVSSFFYDEYLLGNYLVAFIPVLLGFLWIYSYSLVFVIGAIFAFLSLIVTQFIPSNLTKIEMEENTAQNRETGSAIPDIQDNPKTCMSSDENSDKRSNGAAQASTGVVAGSQAQKEAIIQLVSKLTEQFEEMDVNKIKTFDRIFFESNIFIFCMVVT